MHLLVLTQHLQHGWKPDCNFLKGFSISTGMMFPSFAFHNDCIPQTLGPIHMHIHSATLSPQQETRDWLILISVSVIRGQDGAWRTEANNNRSILIWKKLLNWDKVGSHFHVHNNHLVSLFTEGENQNRNWHCKLILKFSSQKMEFSC